MNTVGAFEPIIAGSQIIRLAANHSEVEAAQALRYQVFYEEMGAHPLPEMKTARRDFDDFDNTCDHLVVIDRSEPQNTRVVGTYRFLLSEHAKQAGDFYSSDEYDVTPLKTNGGNIMELGRSCVDAAFRNRQTMQLLWRGIAEYVSANKIDLMFGCASFEGTDLGDLAHPLSYLYHHHLAPETLRPHAKPGRHIQMDVLPAAEVNRKQALSLLPPLIKGYVRVGAYVGDGAVIDHQFNTTDVCIIVKTDRVTRRYARHYALDDQSKPSVMRKAS